MKRHLRRCKECGIPLAYARYLRWYPNGTIIGIDRGRTRLAFLETELINSIIEGISDFIGLDIQPVVVEAERRIGHRFIETIVPSAYIKLGVYRMPRDISVIEPPSRYIFDHVAGLGYGRFFLLSYKRRRRMTVLCRNPYCDGMLIGDSLGVWEFLEQKQGAYQGERENGMLRITLMETREPRPHLEERLAPSAPVYMPGKLDYRICPGCRLPAFPGHTYEWDLEEGIITDRRTSMRMACVPTASLDAVFRELEEELGQEIPRLINDLTKREVCEFLSSLSGGGEEGFREQLREMPLRGFGNPFIERLDSSSCVVRVENPFSPALLEGILCGAASHMWGREALCRSERQHGAFAWRYHIS